MRTIGRTSVLLTLMLACHSTSDSSAVPVVSGLSPEGAQHFAPSYSPDGTKVAYWMPVGDSTAGSQLWVAKADLSNAIKLPVTATFGGQYAIWSPDGTRIASVSGDFGTADVVVVPATGGAVTRVTTSGGIEAPIAWYPDGDRIAYFATSAGGTIRTFVASVSSGVATPLAPNDSLPYLGSPSPDGAHFAYFQIDGSKSTIWVVDSNGANARQLTTEGFEALVQYHEWSPDSKELLYESRRTGTSDLWIVPIDGGKPRQLTRNVRNDVSGVWSPDGKWVAFISDRGRQTDIWVVSSAGGEEQRITDSAIEEQAPLSWRHGTNEVSFTTTDVNSAIWKVDVASGTETQLTADSLRARWFNISPDGSQVDLVFPRGGGIEDLAVMPLAGGEPKLLLVGGGTVLAPWWSPNGKQMVFSSDRGGSRDVWVIDAAGGAPRKLVDWPGFEDTPVWSGDGTAVYFTSDKDARLGDVWKVSANGGAPTRVTRSGSYGGGLASRTGVADIFAASLGKTSGQVGITRIQPDNVESAVWSKTSAGLSGVSISPSGDSVSAQVEQADGKPRSMILAADGSGGRVILKPGEQGGAWSTDGKWMLIQFNAGGARDLGLLEVRSGTTKRLTQTPQDEAGAEFTPDGKTVVFRRLKVAQRISNVDVTSLVGARR